MNFLRFIISLIAGALFSGCASLGPAYAPTQASQPGKSMLYIYRLSHLVGSAYSPAVKLDNEPIGVLANGAYLPVEITSGQHKIEFDSIGLVAAIEFKIGSKAQYFLRLDTTMNNGAKASATNAQTASLGPSGGGAMGAAMSSSFFASKDEKDAAMKAVDPAVTQPLNNPGLLFVKPDFANPEIINTKLGKK